MPLPLAGHAGRPTGRRDLGQQVGRKSFVFEYRITDEVTGRLVAEGCSTQVWYDYAARESRPVPAEIVARMEELQMAPIRRL